MKARNPFRPSGYLYYDFYFFLEQVPAIRYNLLFFKEKKKRISTSIGARPSANFKKICISAASVILQSQQPESR